MKGKIISAEIKALISKALSGENHPNFGKIFSAENNAKFFLTVSKKSICLLF
jgi:hypothetical protein